MVEQLYTIPQAAALKGVTRQAVHLWLQRSGKWRQCVPFRDNWIHPRRWFIPAEVLAEYTPDPDPGRSQALIKSWKERKSNESRNIGRPQK